jgi:HK97 family phage major capsid protein
MRIDFEKGGLVDSDRRYTPEPAGFRLEGRKGRLALQAWAAFGTEFGPKAKVARQRDEAAKELGIKIDAKYIDIELPGHGRRAAAAEARALATQLNTGGGYTVPEDFADEIENATVLFDPIRRLAPPAVVTKHGGPMPWPMSNDSTNAAVIVVENVDPGPLDVAYQMAVLNSYKFHSKRILISNELLEDAPAEMFAAHLAFTLGARIGLGQNASFTTGNGAGAPLGLVNAATQGAMAASPTGIGVNDLFNVMHSVNAVYRLPAMTPAWMMNDNVFRIIHSMQDGAGQRLIQGGPELGQPWSLLGFPVMPNLAMSPTLASGVRSILFGAFQKVKIRDVRSLRLVRLAERYADADQVAFLALRRSDMVLLDAGEHPMCYLQH